MLFFFSFCHIEHLCSWQQLGLRALFAFFHRFISILLCHIEHECKKICLYDQNCDFLFIRDLFSPFKRVGYTWPLPLVWPRVHSFGPGPWHGCTGCPPPLTPAAPRTASIRQCDCNRYRVCVRVYVCSQQQKNNKAKWHPTTSQTSYHHYMKWRCTMIFPSAHYRQKPLVVVSYGYNLNLCGCILIAWARRVAYSVCSQPISGGLWLGLLSCLLLVGVFGPVIPPWFSQRKLVL